MTTTKGSILSPPLVAFRRDCDRYAGVAGVLRRDRGCGWPKWLVPGVLGGAAISIAFGLQCYRIFRKAAS